MFYIETRPAALHVSRQFAERLGVDLAAAGLGLAGLLHVIQAPMHLDHSWEHAAALLSVGLIDLGWTASWVRRRSLGLLWLGWFLVGLTVALYALSRFLPLPFEGQPEPVEPLGLGTQLCELGAALALTAVSLVRRRGLARTLRPLAAISVLALTAAVAFFGAASIAAALMGAG